jgi:hypothetical protein
MWGKWRPWPTRLRAARERNRPMSIATPTSPDSLSPSPSSDVRLPVPAWVAPAFAGLAGALVPWIGYLALSLPVTARAYDRLPWVGFDIGLMAILALTAIWAWRGSVRVAFAATASATMLIVDAWFDVTTSIRSVDVVQALATAVVEVSLAGVCLWIAHHAEFVARTAVRQLLRRVWWNRAMPEPPAPGGLEDET